MNWVDIVLLVLVAASAAQGLRRGAAMQVLSFGGFWLGLLVGALLVPHLAHLVPKGSAEAVLALAVLLGVASIVGGIGRIIGGRSAALLQRLRLGVADQILGVAVAVVATLLGAWLFASVVSGTDTQFVGLSQGVQNSRILCAMQSVLPEPPSLFAKVETFLGKEGLPIVFSGLPPCASARVRLPSDPAVRAALGRYGPSTVEVEGDACGLTQEGSGFAVGSGLVVTNAHVVAGENVDGTVVIDTSGQHQATVVLYDPELDIAVLRVPGLRDPPLHLDGRLVPAGQSGAILGYPEGGPLQAGAAGVEASFDARGWDIYGRNETVRQIYQLEAVVRPGNSGGPFVGPGGLVMGVVFARSTTNPEVGYAIAAPAVAQRVAEARTRTAPASTQGCTQ